MKNHGSNILILFNTWSRFGIEMFVISTYVYSQNTAKRFNAVLKTKLMDSIQSLFECGVNMAIAFFNMRVSSPN